MWARACAGEVWWLDPLISLFLTFIFPLSPFVSLFSPFPFPFFAFFSGFFHLFSRLFPAEQKGGSSSMVELVVVVVAAKHTGTGFCTFGMQGISTHCSSDFCKNNILNRKKSFCWICRLLHSEIPCVCKHLAPICVFTSTLCQFSHVCHCVCL